jgi:hypothetical protein
MQSLGTCTFVFNPDRRDIPQMKKTVAKVDTYSGCAVFQWAAIWPGTIINLEWNFMSAAQYDALYAIYLATANVVYNTDTGGHAYTVQVLDMTGNYFEVVATGLAYRKDVKLQLCVISYAYNPPPPAP